MSGVLAAGGRIPSCGVPRSGDFDGVSTGVGAAGFGAWFCKRSLGAFLSFGCFFFFFEVSPFKPNGAACTFSEAFSSGVAATGPAAIFSCVFFTFATFFSADTSFARALYRVFTAGAAFSSSGFGPVSEELLFSEAAPEAAEDATMALPGVTADAAPAPTSLPEAVSSGPAGSEFRGACPYRIFSRFIFFGLAGVVILLVVGVVGVAVVAADFVTAATGVATGLFPVFTAVEYLVPRSNRFFCWTVFFFTGGGAYAVNTGFVCRGLAPESTYPG